MWNVEAYDLFCRRFLLLLLVIYSKVDTFGTGLTVSEIEMKLQKVEVSSFKSIEECAR